MSQLEPPVPTSPISRLVRTGTDSHDDEAATAAIGAFTDAVMAHVLGDDALVAAANVRRYFDPAGPFTGSQFEVLTDTNHPHFITAADLVAVSTLRHNVIPGFAIWLHGDAARSAVSELLMNVPDDVDLWERPDLLADGSDLARLWDLLRNESWPEPTPDHRLSLPYVSMVLAAKRPRLVPILHGEYCHILAEVDRNWNAFVYLFADADRREAIREATADAPEHVSLLRRLAVVLWMAHRDDGSPLVVDTSDTDAVRVRATSDIADVIGAVLPLTPAGRRLVGPCPFDPEVTGTLSVNRDHGLFFCFHCGAKGDVIEFEQRFWNVDRDDAVGRLAQRAGFDVSDDDN